MPAANFLQRLTEHLLLSAIPVAVGGALAWPVSKYIARQLGRIHRSHTLRSQWAVLFPWRAIVATLIITLLPFVPINYVIGAGAGFFLIGITLASFVLGVVLLTRAHFAQAERQSSLSRLVASSRTMAVVVVAVAVPGYDDLGLGAGSMIWAGRVSLGVGTMWAGIGVVAAVALVFDLLLAYFEYRTLSREQSTGSDANS